MRIILNGRDREVRAVRTVEDLIRSVELDPRFAIVELNGEPLERKRYAQTPVTDGDRIELVRAVAGG